VARERATYDLRAARRNPGGFFWGLSRWLQLAGWGGSVAVVTAQRGADGAALSKDDAVGRLNAR
jgi:hypothetical protein